MWEVLGGVCKDVPGPCLRGELPFPGDVVQAQRGRPLPRAGAEWGSFSGTRRARGDPASTLLSLLSFPQFTSSPHGLELQPSVGSGVSCTQLPSFLT